MKKFTAVCLGFLLVLGACGSSDDGSAPTVGALIDDRGNGGGGSGIAPGVVPGLFASSLQSFDSCDAFLAHVKAEALERVTAYGLPGQGYGWGGPIPFAAAETAAFDSAADGGLATRAAGQVEEPASFSTTNVQEVGVDEPDIVKTDGTRILAVTQNLLHYIDVSGDEPVLRGTLAIPGWNSEILMSGDTAIVAGTVGRYDITPRLASGTFAPDYGYSDISVFTEVDLSDPNDLQVRRTLYVDGRYLSARMVGSTARMVFTSAPVGLDFVLPANGGLRGEKRAEEVNREVIEESTLDNWLPYYILADGDGNEIDEGTLLGCETALAPPEFSGFGMTSVLTIDLDEGLDPSAAVGVLTDGDTIYASSESLYVATQRWIDWNTLDEQGARSAANTMTTYIHKFDISDPARTLYRASGAIDGFLLNQFAMSEFEGNLRVAATDRPVWGWWGSGGPDSASQVAVYSEQDGELVEIGAVGGIGKGEQIYSVRFVDDVAYVVTFRQTDPLFTVDLSDPSNPVVAGELELLGYSAYLHPLGDGLLLGVGQDGTEDGRITGSQISLFDVSEIAKPRRIDSLAFTGGNSEVEYDHRAFLHWAQTGLTVLPVQWWDYSDDYELEDVFLGALALEADFGGLEELGRISQVEPKTDDPWNYDWRGQIRRSLVIGDNLYTLSELGLQVLDLDSLAEVGFLELAGAYPQAYEGEAVEGDAGGTDGTIVPIAPPDEAPPSEEQAPPPAPPSEEG